MSRVFSMFLLAAAIVFSGCASAKNGADSVSNTSNASEWIGVYTGEVPGANSDIKIEIVLNSDLTYIAKSKYLDKSDQTFETKGAFKWIDTNTIFLDAKDIPPYYRVGKNSLTQLDTQGNPISGKFANSYVLKKNPLSF
ncbi:hypothetical protein FACS189487_01690 [Campylobacterota bacterium]|nr:hypothetical protein FACS189487_01690 [Campylobacterota bacterium]